MAYTLHVTGSESNVSVARVEHFSNTTGVAIGGGFAFGTWFYFPFKSAKNVAADKKLLQKWFPGALIETSAERKKRLSQVVVAKPTAMLGSDVHKEIARKIVKGNPGMTASQMCQLVGEANADYADAKGVEHNALDYYAVQSEILSIMKNA